MNLPQDRALSKRKSKESHFYLPSWDRRRKWDKRTATVCGAHERSKYWTGENFGEAVLRDSYKMPWWDRRRRWDKRTATVSGARVRSKYWTGENFVEAVLHDSYKMPSWDRRRRWLKRTATVCGARERSKYWTGENFGEAVLRDLYKLSLRRISKPCLHATDQLAERARLPSCGQAGIQVMHFCADEAKASR